MKDAGRKIEKCDVDAQLEIMMKEYDEFLKHGKKATTRWPGEAKYKSKIRRNLGATSLLFIASIAAGEFTGRNAELAVQVQKALEAYSGSRDDYTENLENSIELAQLMSELFGISADLAAISLLQ